MKFGALCLLVLLFVSTDIKTMNSETGMNGDIQLLNSTVRTLATYRIEPGMKLIIDKALNDFKHDQDVSSDLSQNALKAFDFLRRPNYRTPLYDNLDKLHQKTKFDCIYNSSLTVILITASAYTWPSFTALFTGLLAVYPGHDTALHVADWIHDNQRETYKREVVARFDEILKERKIEGSKWGSVFPNGNLRYR